MPMIHCAKMENKITTKEGKVLTTYHKGCAKKDQCNQTSPHASLDCCTVDRCNTSNTKCYSVTHLIVSTQQTFFQNLSKACRERASGTQGSLLAKFITEV